MISNLLTVNMTKAFEEIVRSELIENLYHSKNEQEIEELKKKIIMALIWKEDSVRKYTDHELFLREDPNSCHYFPFKMDLTGHQLICRQEYHEVYLQVQDSLVFNCYKDFLKCLKDNFRDYVITRLYQLFQDYYTIVTLDDTKYAKNFLNELLATHDYLNSIMQKINILLGEEQQSSYKFYTVYPSNNLMKRSKVFCFHIKTFLNFPQKMFMFKDDNYLNFDEQNLPTVIYKTRKSLIIKCCKCGEQYHKENNNHSNVGSYHNELYL